MAFFNDKPIASLAAGQEHSIVLLQNGLLYAFGFEKCCGSDTKLDTSVPTLVSFPNSTNAIVTSIRCASYCTIIECSHGVWYGFGNNAKQKEPAYGKPITALPSRIDDVFPLHESSQKTVKVKKMVATSNSFFILTTENDLYVIGGNHFGETGLQSENVAKWTKQEDATSIVDVQTGWTIAVLLTN